MKGSKTYRKFVSASLVALSFAVMPAGFAKELVLQYNKKLHQVRAATVAEEKAGKKQFETDVTTNQTIVLGQDYFYVLKPECNSVDFYDFRDQTIKFIDEANKKYKLTAMPAVVMFRQSELQNRARIGSLLNSIGVQDEGPNDIELQSLFGLKFPGQIGGPLIDKANDGAKTKFSYKGKFLAAYEMDAAPMDSTYQKSFARFLTYCTTLYPGVQHQITENPHALKTLEFASNDWPREKGHTTLSLVSVKEQEAPTFDLTNLSQFKLEVTPELESIKKQLSETKPYNQAERLRQAIDEATQSLAAGNKLDAYLALLEYQMETVSLPQLKVQDAAQQKQIDDIQAKAADDEIVKRVAALAGNGVLQDAQASYAWLEKQDTSKIKRGYLIDTWKANVALQSGKLKEPQQLLINALIKNPHLLYAYYVLGFSHITMYDMPLGWQVWELGSASQPTPNWLSDKIDSGRANYVKSHPQYF